ncbi:hypothetical protein ACOSQ3_024667 [Xanthoceras sorbifolium]
MVRGGGTARRGRAAEEDCGGRVKVVRKRTSSGRAAEEQWCYAKSGTRATRR